MLLLLLVLTFLGALEAQKMHIKITPKEEAPHSVPATAEEEAPVIKQLLRNYKKDVQTFVGEISVGTPPQLMSVTFETSSALTYFPSVNCEAHFCKMRRQYNSSASFTHEEVGTPFKLPGSQNASGVLSKDSIGLAGVTIDGVVFGEAQAMWNKWMGVLPQDGVLGLGRRGLAPEGVTPILDLMVDQGLILDRVFGVWLGRDPAGGELTLGGLNEQLYHGDLTWVDLMSPASEWWAAPAGNITIDGHPELDLCPGGECVVMPVASTPYFLTSMTKAKAINAALGGTDIGEPGAASLDCTTLHTLPSLKIELGGRTMEMSPLEYTFVITMDKGVQLCISGFVGMPEIDDSSLLLGTLFMQKYYVAFDGENDRLGFADSV